MKELLEAGVHFGHQTKRWNPKMKDFIFGERNGIYIIDLQKTHRLLQDALQYVQDLAAQGKTILFVGTKRQAQEAVAEEAQRCGMPYVNERWLGGLLTNFVTVRKSLDRLRELEAMSTDGRHERLTKKEVARLEKERGKLEQNLHGIKGMKTVPDAIFVIDTRKEAIAVQEARKLKIPVVGIVDTNCDPDEVDHVIPGNDDALRAIRLFAGRIADAVLAGRGLREARGAESGRGGQGRARRRTKPDGGRPRPARAMPAPDAHRLIAVRLLRASVAAPGPFAPGLFTRVRENAPVESDRMEHLSRDGAQAPRGDRRGMMDCKAALVEADGDIEKAREILRKKGLAAAAKKAGRTASEGMIGTYIHPGAKIGVHGGGELRDRLRGQDARVPGPGQGHRDARRRRRPAVRDQGGGPGRGAGEGEGDLQGPGRGRRASRRRSRTRSPRAS